MNSLPVLLDIQMRTTQYSIFLFIYNLVFLINYFISTTINRQDKKNVRDK